MDPVGHASESRPRMHLKPIWAFVLVFFVCVCVSMCALECVYACIWGPEVRVSASPVLLLQASRLHVRSKHGMHISD